ncbi:protein GLUTAMINE DUMPER 1-like [Amaranthus tricolor]|uniref:protein GLUTAMINE DUMPER 1-like n=1 Tax=Amaranthus tricolor TaxID=29722 RepID=UPI00258AABB5|nr:protein GLUTAMINE DUMPER 1-like [Amaranthus tricolor]
MKQSGVTKKFEGTFEAHQRLPNQHQHHYITPPPAGWKSPVPYLFGGLAAMLGLIAFALLILACSYWKLSGYQNSDAGENSDESTGDEKPKEAASATAYLNSILVIMAGEEKPTFLATPATSRASSFGNSESSEGSCSVSSSEGEEKEEEIEHETTTLDDDEKR